MSNPLKYGAGLDSDKEIAIQSSDLPEAVTPEYSTLEVVTAETESRFAEYNKPAPQLVLNPFRDDASAPEVISFDGKEPIKANEEVLEKPRRRRRHLFLIALIISAIVVVVAAAVLGALA